jgi:capsid protein
VEALVQAGDFEGQLDFYGLQSLIARTVFESGECLVRRIREAAATSGEVPLKLQVLEPDYIDSTRSARPTATTSSPASQIDRGGRRTGYWLWDQHPGEYVTFPMSLQSRFHPAPRSCTSTRRSAPASCAACRAWPSR